MENRVILGYPCRISKKKPRLHKTLSMMILATLCAELLSGMAFSIYSHLRSWFVYNYATDKQCK